MCNNGGDKRSVSVAEVIRDLLLSSTQGLWHSRNSSVHGSGQHVSTLDIKHSNYLKEKQSHLILF